jgi:CRP-like cAMP-binding protein
LPADRPFNQVLADLMQVEPPPWANQLELVELPARHELHSPGVMVAHVYFPASALVGLRQMAACGTEAPVALVGNDGVVGVAAFMGTAPEGYRAEILHPGSAWRLPTDALSKDGPHAARVVKAAVGYLLSLTSQISLTAFCQQHHSVEQRFSRWLLSALDRLPGNEVAMDIGDVAPWLGVSPDALADAAAQLVSSGALVCEPGRLVVPSRPALAANSCGCHALAQGALHWASPGTT